MHLAVQIKVCLRTNRLTVETVFLRRGQNYVFDCLFNGVIIMYDRKIVSERISSKINREIFKTSRFFKSEPPIFFKAISLSGLYTIIFIALVHDNAFLLHFCLWQSILSLSSSLSSLFWNCLYIRAPKRLCFIFAIINL